MDGSRRPDSIADSIKSPQQSSSVDGSDTNPQKSSNPAKQIPSPDEGYGSGSTTPVQEKKLTDRHPQVASAGGSDSMAKMSDREILKAFRNVADSIRDHTKSYLKQNPPFPLTRQQLPYWINEPYSFIRLFRTYDFIGLNLSNPRHEEQLVTMRQLEKQFITMKNKRTNNPESSYKVHYADIFVSLAAIQTFLKKYDHAKQTIDEGFVFAGNKIVFGLQDVEYDLKLADFQLVLDTWTPEKKDDGEEKK